MWDPAEAPPPGVIVCVTVMQQLHLIQSEHCSGAASTVMMCTTVSIAYVSIALVTVEPPITLASAHRPLITLIVLVILAVLVDLDTDENYKAGV